jgi:hypothetical protein
VIRRSLLRENRTGTGDWVAEGAGRRNLLLECREISSPASLAEIDYYSAILPDVVVIVRVAAFA